jgi:FlaA1/EpsC-like NDP-sugar epimerase
LSPTSIPSLDSLGKSIGWRLLASFKDVLVLALAAFLAFNLRFDGAVPIHYQRALWVALCVWCIAKTLVLAVGGTTRRHWQYTSIYDAQRLILLNTAGSIIAAMLLLVLLGPWGVPRSIYILEWVLSGFLLMVGSLVFRAVGISMAGHWAKGVATQTLIYGAGAAGLQLLWELRQNRSLKCDVVGFIDDDPSKIGLKLAGKRVLGTGDNLQTLAAKHGAKKVLIAIPSATGQEISRIFDHLVDSGLEYKTVPSLGDLINGKNLGGQIRDIAVEDLLGRKAVRLNQDHIKERIQGKVVMVTGAAGSIGSELCRQIARFNPAALIGFDVAETPLFQIDRELRRTFPDLVFHPEVGSITSTEHLRRAIGSHRPAIIYHSAAYKHVPLMERHVFAAVENNIFGTWNTAITALDFGVEDFVMISSDKAVHPTSMMGATKRVAELLIRSLQKDNRTKFVSVRFGNVLGSNGSVVPIFKEQIACGGPVTVTHPDMRRYFMTIPEASQLVLQAFAIGKGGDVFLLDMGEPVKIVDLARSLILLSGLKPDKDIEIKFTGLRPGEKLFEELNLNDESLVPTSHAKIRRYLCPTGPDMARLRVHLQSLARISTEGNLTQLVSHLTDLIPDYVPDIRLMGAPQTDAGHTLAVQFEMPVNGSKRDLVLADLGSTPELS